MDYTYRNVTRGCTHQSKSLDIRPVLTLPGQHRFRDLPGEPASGTMEGVWHCPCRLVERVDHEVPFICGFTGSP